jgi:hypothetical protein
MAAWLLRWGKPIYAAGFWVTLMGGLLAVWAASTPSSEIIGSVVRTLTLAFVWPVALPTLLLARFV